MTLFLRFGPCSSDEPAPPLRSTPSLKLVHLDPHSLLAEYERLIAEGRATEATRTRAEALRRQLTAAALHPQPRAAE